jgi:hypothetical protein
MNKIWKAVNLAVALVMLVALFARYQPAAASPAHAAATDPGDFIPGQVVVGFTSSDVKAVSAQATALAGSVNAQVVSQYGSLALLSFSPDADVSAVAAQLKGQAGVSFAEPDYVLRLSTQAGSAPAAATQVTRTSSNGTTFTVPMDTLHALGDVSALTAGPLKPGYPNDPYLWTDWGWQYVGADIVWPNKTASANICELDTGVDYLHPDLKASVTKGFDFVNNDSDPMDDNGNGTAMAGVMVAKMGNAEGIAGISTGKLVAVKVVNAQGWAVAYNVAAGINYCANLSSVKVLTLGVTSNYNSTAIYNALLYAINTKGKLVVAAAGDYNSGTFVYPAAWANDPLFQHKLLAVAAVDDGTTASYSCRAAISNYGEWIGLVAPGTNIFTTTPYDKPFYMNYKYGTPARYATMSGTVMAAAFVAAGAARRWGYKPAETNLLVGSDLFYNSSKYVNADGICWPTSMNGIPVLNVAYQLERGAAYAYIRNSTTALPLPGAQFQLYQGTKLISTGTEPAYNSPYVEAINLPAGTGYTAKVNLSGVTAGPQPAFQHSKPGGSAAGAPVTIAGGKWTYFGDTAVPPKSGNFDLVDGWGQDAAAITGQDLDLLVWLPATPNPLDISQPANFIVSYWSASWEGNSYGYLEGNSSGTLLGFPFALNNRDGGNKDTISMESTTISKRLAHAPLSANANLPYYPGFYWVAVTDFGMTFSSGTYSGDHVLRGTWPFVYLWKDGAIKAFSEDGGCNTQYWYPFKITSGISGSAPVITYANLCYNIEPYALDSSGPTDLTKTP